MLSDINSRGVDEKLVARKDGVDTNHFHGRPWNRSRFLLWHVVNYGLIGRGFWILPSLLGAGHSQELRGWSHDLAMASQFSFWLWIWSATVHPRHRQRFLRPTLRPTHLCISPWKVVKLKLLILTQVLGTYNLLRLGCILKWWSWRCQI